MNAIMVFLVVVILLTGFAYFAVREIWKTPTQTRKYPMFEHRTNRTSKLLILIGTAEKHDLQIVKYRWSGRIEASVDNEKPLVHEPKKSKEELSMGFMIGTREVHEVEIKRDPSAKDGITVIIDGAIDYVFWP